MGAEGRYDLQLADSEGMAEDQETSAEASQNEQQQEASLGYHVGTILVFSV